MERVETSNMLGGRGTDTLIVRGSNNSKKTDSMVKV